MRGRLVQQHLLICHDAAASGVIAIKAVIAVGGMSGEVSEDTFNRMLMLQSLLSKELTQILEKSVVMAQWMSAASQNDDHVCTGRGLVHLLLADL